MDIQLSKRERRDAERAKIMREARAQQNRDGWFYLTDVLEDVLDTRTVPQYDFIKWSRDLQDRGLIAHVTVPGKNYGHFTFTSEGTAFLALTRR